MRSNSFSPKCGAYLRALLNRVNTIIGNIIISKQRIIFVQTDLTFLQYKVFMQNVCPVSFFVFSNTEDFAFAPIEKMSTKMKDAV